MTNPVVDKLVGRLAGLLEWHGLGSAVLTPRPRGGRLHGDDAAEVGWFTRDDLPPLVFYPSITLTNLWRAGALEL